MSVLRVRERDRQTDRQTERERDRQTDRQRERDRERERESKKMIYSSALLSNNFSPEVGGLPPARGP